MRIKYAKKYILLNKITLNKIFCKNNFFKISFDQFYDL